MYGMNDMFKSFGDMNAMSKQMMETMMGQMNANQAKGANNFMPFFPPMANMMPDEKQIKQMNKMMSNMFPDPQVMLQKALPSMQQQMNQTICMMTEINNATQNMMQMVFDQNCAMAKQFMSDLNKFAYAGTKTQEAEKADAEAEVVEDAE